MLRHRPMGLGLAVLTMVCIAAPAFADPIAVVVAILNLKVGFEEIDDRQIGCGLAV